jgi:Tfp pilus assembly protein PilE
VSAVAVIELPSYRWSPSDRWNRLVARLREDRGVGLVELLIALLVLNIGIFATLAAFTSGALAIRRASHVSTASALADKNMETYRDMAYGSMTNGTTTGLQTGADGRTYSVQVVVSGGTVAESTGGSTQVKVVTVTVTDPKDSTVDVVNSSTFSRCTQSALTASDTTACKS